MSLVSTGRRAERFADLLETGRRTDDPVVAPFLALAGALRAVPAVAGPRPEFRDALRQRLVAVATVQGVGPGAVPAGRRIREVGGSWRFQRGLAVVAGGAAAATAIAGVGLGASRSLPGDPLYGVKRATEDVQLATTFGAEAKGKRHLEFARTRLSEVEALVGRSSALTDFIPGAAGAIGPLTEAAKSQTIIETLRDMDEETRAGADALVDVYRTSGSREPLRTLDAFTQEQFGDLRAVLPALPETARPRAELSLSLLDAVAHRTVSLATAPHPPGTGGGGPAPTETQHPRTTTPSAPETSGTPDEGDGGSAGPEPSPSDGSKLTQPTDVPTIPPLPTSLPTLLPTSLPTLLPSLPLLG